VTVSTGDSHLYLVEFIEITNTNTLDVAQSKFVSTGGVINNPLTPSASGDMILAVGAYAGNFSITPNGSGGSGGYTALEHTANTFSMGSGYLTGASTASTDAAMQMAHNDSMCGITLAFKANAGPIVNGSGLQSFSNTAGPVTYTTSWSVGSGNTLLVLYSCTDNNLNGSGIASVADGQGSYTQDAHFNPGTAIHFDEGSFRLSNTTAGTHAIVLTMNASAAAYGSFVVVELAGIWTFDATLGTNHGASTTPTVTGSAPAANDFQVAIYCGTTASDEPGSPAGWNGSFMGIPASGWPSAGYVWMQSASAAGSVSFGTLSASDTWGAMIVGYSPPAAVTTLTAAFGTFTLTGEAASFIQGQPQALLLLANPGAFNFQGAQGQSQLQLYALNTSFSLSGEAASFTQGSGLTTLTAAAGSYVMTGEAATLQAGRYVFSAFTGTFSMTGEAATLVSSGAAPPGYEFLPNYIGLYWLEGSRF